MKINIAKCVLGMALALAGEMAMAQAYPSKPVRVIVPFAPGSVLDVIARLVAEKMSAGMGRPVLVEARPGAGGRLGAEQVMRSPPDGYTTLFTSSGSLVGGAFLVKAVGYDTLRDFTAISAAVSPVDCLIVHVALPVNSAAELIDYARRNPGKLAYGSNGIGSTFHMVGELVKQVAGIDMLHVPYQGAPEQTNAVITGQIQVAFNSFAVSRAQSQAGKVKLLAVLRDQRYAGAPNVPTLSEALPGYQALPNWFGYFGPAALPPPLLARLNAEIVKGLRAPDVLPKLDDAGVVPIGDTPEQFAALMRATQEGYARAVKAAKLEPQ
jgi:tripartite-type tricarboxylate transporter receptor subunit TctC